MSTTQSTAALPTLKRGVALVLVGPQGCGKSLAAAAIAQQYGSHASISAEVLSSPHELAGVLIQEPATLIIGGAPRTGAALAVLKAMLTSERTRIHPKHREATEVRSPNLIFCSGDTDPLFSMDERRFAVFNMPAVRAS